MYIYVYIHNHWRRSALNSAGALQGRGGEIWGIFTPFYTINFRGLCKNGGARAPAAPPSSAPMCILDIHWAAMYGHVEIEQLLMETTNNPNAPTTSGLNPIIYEACKGKWSSKNGKIF